MLQGVSLQAAQGTVVAVLGRNGMGKTTLMRSIIGYTPTAPRSALVQGQDGHEAPSYLLAQNAEVKAQYLGI